MVRLIRSVCVVATVACLLAGSAWAGLVPVLLDPMTFSDLDVTGPVTAVMTSNYNYAGTFTGRVMSQTFVLDDGTFLYLYQVDNYGTSYMEKFTVGDFPGLLAPTGYLTGGEPAGFLPPDVDPLGAAYDAALSQPTLGFDYTAFFEGEVEAGHHTSVMYAIAPHGPTEGEAYLLDQGIAVVAVFVPTPEPATLGLMGLGLVFAATSRIRRRR
ncbi:MAG TPA: PEP-CTERM sorting domain-containing protein [Phycisphaerae bacterium]|nr:PEP-CTERM sorting domain-containing protein [Phycisphaerae bacterium]